MALRAATLKLMTFKSELPSTLTAPQPQLCTHHKLRLARAMSPLTQLPTELRQQILLLVLSNTNRIDSRTQILHPPTSANDYA